MSIGGVGTNNLGRSYLHNTDNSVGRPSSLSLYKPPIPVQVSIHPQGRQHLSMLSHSDKAPLSASLIRPNLPIQKAANKSSKAEQAVTAVEYTGTALTHAGHLTVSGLNLVKAGHIIPKNAKVSTEALDRSLKAFEGIKIAGQSIVFVKSTGESIYRAVRDVAAHGKRKEAQSLLKSFNAETRQFDDGVSHKGQQAKLQHLMSEKKSDLSRSKKQIAIDRLAQIAGNIEQAGGVARSAIAMAENSSKLAAKALPGLGIALAAMSTVQSAIKTGSQISALNNLAKAKSATKDPLLQALAGHIKQERTINARKNLASTAVSLATTGAAIGLAASGVGAPAASIATGAIGAAVSVGSTAFSVWHGRKLSVKRKQADLMMKSGRPLKALVNDNIGVAEKVFLARLREANGQQLKEAVTFLRNFGLSDSTIKKLQLAPEEAAFEKLRAVLYEDKVKYKGLQLKQTAKTLAHVIGLSAAAKRIKTGSLWLIKKLKPDKSKGELGNSLFSCKVGPQGKSKQSYAFSQPLDNSLRVQDYLQKRLAV